MLLHACCAYGGTSRYNGITNHVRNDGGSKLQLMELGKLAERAKKLNSCAVTTSLGKGRFKIHVPHPYYAMFITLVPTLVQRAFDKDFIIETKDENTIILVEKP